MSLDLAKNGDLIVLALQAIVVLIMAWLGTRFASKKGLDDTIMLANRAHSRLDLVEERMKGLPTYGVVNELRKGVGELKEGQAAGREKMDGIKGDLHVMRDQISSMDEFLRTRP